MASLPSILILGTDTIAAANPATAVQLVHACRLWGFSAVVPASWGDELIATDMIRRCASRSSRPVIQCSCPRVADRLTRHAPLLDDAVFWLVPPPVAAARYLRAIEPDRALHVTYAGACPGASDPCIDERITPHDLLAALSARGIDLASQSTIFEDIIPADRRRYASSPGGLPEQHRLWEDASFRVAQPLDADLSIGVAQLLLTEERLLIDLSPTLGCECRSGSEPVSATVLHRSASPVITAGKIDLSRSVPEPPVPALRPGAPDQRRKISNDVAMNVRTKPAPVKPPYRRQSTWRRQSPRPGIIVARGSGVMLAINEPVPILRRPETRWIIAFIVTALIVSFLVGRRSVSTARGSVGAQSSIRPSQAMQILHSRAP